jgi:hypothetical protein
MSRLKILEEILIFGGGVTFENMSTSSGENFPRIFFVSLASVSLDGKQPVSWSASPDAGLYGFWSASLPDAGL